MGIWYAERYNLLDRIALPPSIGSMVDDEEVSPLRIVPWTLTPSGAKGEFTFAV